MTRALPSPLSVSMDAITPLLWQGSRPPGGTYLRDRGFSLVVLAAKEFQPHAAFYPGVQVVRAHLDDSGVPMTNTEWYAACEASSLAAEAIRQGRRVYSSCHMGQNRSGLVAALVLVRTTGMSGHDAIRHVKLARPYALGNCFFCDALARIPGRFERRPRAGDVVRAWPVPLRARA